MPCLNEVIYLNSSCCPGPPTEYQLRSAEFYSCVLGYTEKLRKLARGMEILGASESKINKNYDLMNDFGYLYLLLTFAYLDKQILATNDPCDVMLYDEYNFTCIEEGFKCKGFDVSNLIQVFIEDDLSDGIGADSIEIPVTACGNNSNVLKSN